MSILVANGLYKLKDCYFTEFGNALMMDNKQESRPYYYLYQDPEGIDWAIPLSSQVNNYRRKIAAIEAKRGKGKCVYYYIGKIASVDRVFLITRRHGSMAVVIAVYVDEIPALAGALNVSIDELFTPISAQ